MRKPAQGSSMHPYSVLGPILALSVRASQQVPEREGGPADLTPSLHV